MSLFSKLLPLQEKSQKLLLFYILVKKMFTNLIARFNLAICALQFDTWHMALRLTLREIRGRSLRISDVIAILTDFSRVRGYCRMVAELKDSTPNKFENY